MEKSYAVQSGFSHRLSTSKVVKGFTTHRYILCTRAGKPNFQSFDSAASSSISRSRHNKFKVTDCKARIRLKGIPGTTNYVLYEFVEAHNHRIIDKANMDLSKNQRKLGFSDQEFIHKLSLNNIGANVAHMLQVSLKGGHHKVRGTKIDYKNFVRDIQLFIGDKDAQMIVDSLEERVMNRQNFSFEFTVIGTELRSLFWVDDVMKCNYEEFGDV
ncbi:hypothetical protein QVD17_30689 [Tagetes erecta]|uniref:FAR1 domain-containing protein n=1 Tax=Tagetes erecta TaxID=13708 RepID=A0AAD8K203_TARER|nr:hypothetical protein QVD17_30689 [Tagetes erecta]